ncbi:DNA-binding protein [Methylobacterium sp. 17Sr1-1]|nr:DNA-binding protein [Methylobacterium sp. 17Sr1-1]
MEKAEQAARSARMLLIAGDLDGACNRAYYAMFDAAQAALIAWCQSSAGSASKTHRSLIAAFGRDLVQTGRIDADFGRALNRVHEIRLLADYTDEPPSLVEAEWAVAQAELLLAVLRTKIKI